MKFPSADRYSEAVQNPTVYFADAEVKRRRVQTDALGLPEVLSGGFAFTYRFTGLSNDIAVRCFHREIPELFERYQAISTFLASLRSSFFVDFAFTERGVRIDGTELPVVRMRWIEGETLLGYVSRRRSDPGALGRLREQILSFAREAESQGYAHGDIQHRNFMVSADETLRLVDYDGMYVPPLRHLRAADAGHPHFQLPSRASTDFGPRMDRFPLAVIDLSLEALQEAPQLFDQFHRGENLIFSRDDFLDPAASPVLNAIARIPRLAPRVASFSDLCGLSARETPSLQEFRTGPAGAGARTVFRTTRAPAARQIYTSPFDVANGMDYSTTVRFVGRQVEMVGQILQIKKVQEKGLVLLRFGTSYASTPTIVMPQSVFAKWAAAPKMKGRPWVSAVGVLQTHRSWRYSTIQIMVKDASDVELLANKEEADFRLGRTTRASPAASQPAGAPTIIRQPQPAASPPPREWKISREPSKAVPDWMQNQNTARGPVSRPQMPPVPARPAAAPTAQAPSPSNPAQQSRPSPSVAVRPSLSPSAPTARLPMAIQSGTALGQPTNKGQGILARMARFLFGRAGA